MNDSQRFTFRTEDLRPEDILDLFVPTERDLQLVEGLRSANPFIIEGSRGTGKSFLLRVCEQRQIDAFAEQRVIPVYVSFVRSSLLSAKNEQQFQHWMLSRLCSRILRSLYQLGLLAKPSPSAAVLAGGAFGLPGQATPLELIAEAFENSYRTPGIEVDDSVVPSVEEFKDAIQDLCEDLRIRRFNILFDEAAHIFRPEQQRQFFTLFRDLRSPYMTCNAAVYPGVTSYGPSFEAVHDAQIESLNRDVTAASYREQMRDIVVKQASSKLQEQIERNGENFDALAFAVSGNPRLLLKTVALAPTLRSSEVESVIKEFYRTAIWAEHSGLSERYPGHRVLIDWGRKFVEDVAIRHTLRRNEDWREDGTADRTCYFWIDRDAPGAVIEALRLLAYTGVVVRLDSGVVATRKRVGTRYSINLGCVTASAAKPIEMLNDLRRRLTIKRFSEYGKNDRRFVDLAQEVGDLVEADTSATLAKLLKEPITILDLTDYQKGAMASIGIATVGKALASTESDFQRANYIGPVRSRQIMNVVTAAALEFLSG